MKKADKFDAGKWLIENKITTQSRLNEDLSLASDIALNIVGGLAGLWTLFKGAPKVVNMLKDKAEAAKLKAKKDRLETIKSIVAKFQDDETLKNMYKQLSSYDLNDKDKNQQTIEQLKKIAEYIKSKLDKNEVDYLKDISNTLRKKEEITINNVEDKIKDLESSYYFTSLGSLKNLKDIANKNFDINEGDKVDMFAIVNQTEKGYYKSAIFRIKHKDGKVSYMHLDPKNNIEDLNIFREIESIPSKDGAFVITPSPYTKK